MYANRRCGTKGNHRSAKGFAAFSFDTGASHDPAGQEDISCAALVPCPRWRRRARGRTDSVRTGIENRGSGGSPTPVRNRRRVHVRLLGQGRGLDELGQWADWIRSEPSWTHTAPLALHERCRRRAPGKATGTRREGDILWAIGHFAQELKDLALPAERRLDALRFLGPLRRGHPSTAACRARVGPRGGNTSTGSFGHGRNDEPASFLGQRTRRSGRALSRCLCKQPVRPGGRERRVMGAELPPGLGPGESGIAAQGLRFARRGQPALQLTREYLDTAESASVRLRLAQKRGYGWRRRSTVRCAAGGERPREGRSDRLCRPRSDRYADRSVRNFSTSSAAMQPEPAEVTACR